MNWFLKAITARSWADKANLVERSNYWKGRTFSLFVRPKLAPEDQNVPRFWIDKVMSGTQRLPLSMQPLQDTLFEELDEIYAAHVNKNLQRLDVVAKKAAETWKEILKIFRTGQKRKEVFQQTGKSKPEHYFDKYVAPHLMRDMNLKQWGHFIQYLTPRENRDVRLIKTYLGVMNIDTKYRDGLLRAMQNFRSVAFNNPTDEKMLMKAGYAVAVAANLILPSEMKKEKWSAEQIFMDIVGPNTEERYPALNNQGYNKFRLDISTSSAYMQMYSPMKQQWHFKNQELYNEALKHPPFMTEQGVPSTYFEKLIQNIKKGHSVFQSSKSQTNRPFLLNRQQQHQDQARRQVGRNEPEQFPPYFGPNMLQGTEPQEQTVQLAKWKINFLKLA